MSKTPGRVRPSAGMAGTLAYKRCIHVAVVAAARWRDADAEILLLVSSGNQTKSKSSTDIKH